MKVNIKMKVNKDFPIIPVNSRITFIDRNNVIQRNKKVIRVWYPKDGELFTEAEEIKNLGWCVSDPSKLFPQLIVSMGYNIPWYRICGDNLQSIISYTLPENEG